MHLVTAFLISVAANLDNGGVGVAYGLRKIKIPIVPNLLIALLASAGTGAFGLLGERVGIILSLGLDNGIGALVIIGVGLWVLAGGRGAASSGSAPPRAGAPSVFQDPSSADRDRSGDISTREALLLGVALGVNAWAGGLGAGLLKIPLAPVVLLTGLMSLALLALGQSLGSQVATRWLGPRATVVAGLLLIGIGIHQLL